MKYEVRCCVPEKLVGWLEWPDESQTVWKFQLLEPMPPRPWEQNAATAVPFETLVLTLDYYSERGSRYEAVKAEGVPIEKLRRIPGFVENK